MLKRNRGGGGRGSRRRKTYCDKMGLNGVLYVQAKTGRRAEVSAWEKRTKRAAKLSGSISYTAQN